MSTTKWLPTVLVAIAGCGGMMTGPDAMHGSIGDAIQEDQEHLSNARAVTTLAAMIDEVDRHVTRMTVIVSDMRTDMASMHHCSGIDSMITLRDGMQAEIDAHAATMHAEADLKSARSDVENHVGAMSTMLDEMSTMIDRTHCSGW